MFVTVCAIALVISIVGMMAKLNERSEKTKPAASSPPKTASPERPPYAVAPARFAPFVKIAAQAAWDHDHNRAYLGRTAAFKKKEKQFNAALEARDLSSVEYFAQELVKLS